MRYVGPQGDGSCYLRGMKRIIIPFAAGVAAGSLAMSRCGGEAEAAAVTVKADTVTVTDTVLVEKPVEKIRTKVRTVVRPMALAADTTDTVAVRVGMERKVYQTDDYRAVVSGYEASLDTLLLRRELTRVTLTPATQGRGRRWGVSVTAGVALTPAGVQPMIGIGVSYRLASF